MRHRLFVCATFSLALTASAVAAEAVTASALRVAPVQVIVGNAQSTTLDAVVEAGRQTMLAAQVPGAIVSLAVKAGDRVKAGQVLIRLDARTAQSGVESNHAQLEAARAQAALADRDLKRQQALFEKQYISQAAVERTRVALETAQAQVRALAAQVGAATTQTTYYTLSAPYAGVVSEVPVSLGDLAQPGKPLLTIYDPSSLRISSNVPESVSSALKSDASLTIGIDGLPDFQVSKWQLLPALDAVSHTRIVRAALPPEMQASLAPGNFARISLPGRTPKEATPRLFVPSAAILRRAELWVVYAMTPDGRPHLRQVRLGEARGDQVEVLSGLREGESVALDPQAAAQVR